MDSIPTIDEQSDRIFAWRRGFNASWLIDLGIKLNIFSELAAHPDSALPALAARLGLDPWHLEVWCKTAVAFEILDATPTGGYCLAPHMDKVLASPGHPRYIGGYVQLGTDYASADFLALRTAFRTGEYAPFQGRDERFSSHVADATYGLQFLAARQILPGIDFVKAQLAAGGALLEVGPGSARLLLMLAKTFPAARLVGVDIDPTGVRVARAAVTQANLSTQISIIEGRVDDAISAGPFAAVVMVEVLHEIQQALRAGVVAACFRALMPGGWLVIVDETYPETAAELRAPLAQFAVQTAFEELHWGNIIPTQSEQTALLAAAGFGAPVREVMGAGFTILKAQRPAV